MYRSISLLLDLRRGVSQFIVGGYLAEPRFPMINLIRIMGGLQVHNQVIMLSQFGYIRKPPNHVLPSSAFHLVLIVSVLDENACRTLISVRVAISTGDV